MHPIEPVVHRVTVRLSPQRAFDLFTRGIASWWPFRGHSCGDEDAADVAFEPRVGGAVTEIGRSGSRHCWGSITSWEPPLGFSMQWHPGQPVEHATWLEVRFVAMDAACTEVCVRHGGWESRGPQAEGVREGYREGWAVVLGCLVRRAEMEKTV